MAINLLNLMPKKYAFMKSTWRATVEQAEEMCDELLKVILLCDRSQENDINEILKQIDENPPKLNVENHHLPLFVFGKWRYKPTNLS